MKNDIMETAYQLIHRTASACILNGKNKHVVYQCFNSGKLNTDYYKNELKKMYNLTNSPKKLKFHLLIFDIIRKTPEYRQLELLWDNMEKKDGTLNEKVKSELKKYPIMSFSKPISIKIK